MSYVDYKAISGPLAIAANDKPAVGRLVTVERGKHKGKTGIVTWHGKDGYSDAFRYCNGYQAAMREARGRHGYRVQILANTGETFFTKAEYAAIAKAEGATEGAGEVK